MANYSTITPLDHISVQDERRSGAKAYNCARLRQAGFRVPDGIVVSSDAAAEEVAALTQHPWFDALPSYALFAVQSSSPGEDAARQSFSGIHQTVLNVGRRDLPNAVAACQASARSAQALEYRRGKGLPAASVETAVLIQRMVQPIASGVASTVNPVTGSNKEIVINSSWGVGEALVSGHMDPDEFVISKRDGTLLWSRIGDSGQSRHANMFSLSSDQVRELTEILTDIERHYGAPQDVEWRHDGSTFWLVQTRPITTAESEATELNGHARTWSKYFRILHRQARAAGQVLYQTFLKGRM